MSIFQSNWSSSSDFDEIDMGLGPQVKKLYTKQKATLPSVMCELSSYQKCFSLDPYCHALTESPLVGCCCSSYSTVLAGAPL